jgi:hypothetical protein
VMLYLVHRPVSGDVVGMDWQELQEFLSVPDHKGLDIRVETAHEIEQHICQVMPAEVPRD